ncbi:hypothetical protein [Halobacteriovorax sp. HLS]|uniref:hypothetical protein n=1 Tax=Halobacteriovorax sp. HLS TaxID=2234000 RepID=UPI000FDCD705|nr:hypothetical protein [Halobacteriovorax sp. HLS]
MKFSICHCPLKNTITVGEVVISERKWIEIDLEEIGKKVDLAPLPGLHQESLEEALEDFHRKVSITPSAQFAKDVIRKDFFNNTDRSKINKLDYIDLTQDPKSYLNKWSKGDIIKLKIGRNSLEQEKKWLDYLFELDLTSIKFRLDANRSLTAEQLDYLLQGIDPKHIEYLEEPLIDIEHWSCSKASEKFELALDENISKRNLIESCKFLVVKPTYNLSLADTIDEIEKAYFKVIISSSFDPPNNIDILHRLGNLSGTSCGLDTLKYFDLAMIKKRPL